MERLLSDNIYKIIDKHPTKKFTDELRSLLDERKMSINEFTYKRLLNTDRTILDHIYGLPQVHKINVPLRIIVSSISPLYKFVLYLHYFIKY